MSHHKLEIKSVDYVYPDTSTKVINSLSAVITHGESIALLGANGAGKSTLLMLLMGILSPVSGEIYVGEVLMTQKTLPDIRKRVGFVFQNPDDQLFMSTIYDDVAFGPRNAGLSEAEVTARVTEALERTGISHLKNRAPFRCSGGEKRAAAISGVLAMKPDILILDEPSSDLDPKARRKVIDLLKTFDHTKIIASHDIDMVYELCQRTIIIQNGQLKADGDTKKIVTDSVLMDNCGLIAIENKK